MEYARAAAIQQVTDTFAAWRKINDDIQRKKLVPRPQDATELAQFRAELRILEAEAERLLLSAQLALLKIRTPRSSSDDSTWG